MEAEDKPSLKVVLTGCIKSGKSSIFETFCKKPKSSKVKIASNLDNLRSRNVKIEHGGHLVTVKIDLWDSTGIERYINMCTFYYHGAKAALICFDITNITSWYNSVQHYYCLREIEENCRIYFVGTKLDMVENRPEKRQVHQTITLNFVNMNNAKLFEISTLNISSVLNIFEIIAEDFYQEWKVKRELKIYSESIIVKKDNFITNKEGCGNNHCYN